MLPLPLATAFMTIALGAMVAADKPLPLWLVVGGAVVLGLLHGSGNGVELARQNSGLLGAVGIAVALFAFVAMLAGQITSVRAAWARIVVRVAGSWIAAMGLFMLGWSVKR
jgi:hydrogenase/urease accessory protein HupE